MKAIFRNLTSVAIVVAMVSLSGCATGDTAEAGNLFCFFRAFARDARYFDLPAEFLR